MGTTSSKESKQDGPCMLPINKILNSRSFCEAPPLPPPPLAASISDNAPPPPPAHTSSPQEDAITNAAASVSDAPLFPNPGPYETALMDSKRLLNLDTHDGFRVDINKQLSPYMAVVHSFWLGTSMIPDGRTFTYTFLTQVADEQGFIMARLDPARASLDGRIHRAALGGLAMMKLQFNVSMSDDSQQQPSNDQLLGELDFGGGTWTANLKYGSMAGGNVYGCNYFQHINNRWAVGGEGMYLSANRAMISSYTVKYNSASNAGKAIEETAKAISGAASTEFAPPKVYTVAAQFSPAQQMVSLNYQREVTPKRVTLAAQLEFNPMSLESQATFGAEFKLTRSKMSIVMDQGARIQSNLECKLGMAPGSPSLNFSAEVDHAKELMRFGYGLNIGG